MRNRRPIRLPLATIASLVALPAVGCRPAARPAPSPAPTTTPAPAPSPAEPMPAPATPTTAPASRFALLPGPASYDVQSEATVEMTAGPDAERGKETVTTTARVAYEVAPATRGTTGLTGRVEGLAVQASDRVTGGAPLPGGPVLFRGTVDVRAARIDLDVPALGCLSPAGTAQAAALAAARETVLRVPATIAVGARWRDSATVATCRGAIGTLVTTVARYEVTAIDGAVVRVRRETSLSLRGGGIAGGRSVTLSGSGSGTANLELDATRGRLTRSEGETRSTVTVTLPDGSRQFAQQVRTRVTGRGT